jgi:hypothetical protein
MYGPFVLTASTLESKVGTEYHRGDLYEVFDVRVLKVFFCGDE